MQWFVNRMKEPSTWLGLAQLAATAATSGVSLSGPAVFGIIGGVAGILLKEKGAQ